MNTGILPNSSSSCSWGVVKSHSQTISIHNAFARSLTAKPTLSIQNYNAAFAAAILALHFFLFVVLNIQQTSTFIAIRTMGMSRVGGTFW